MFKRLFGGSKPPLSQTEIKRNKLIDEAMRAEAERVAEVSTMLSLRDQFIAAHENDDAPWAMFEIKDFPEDGQVKVEFNWNDAFIERINKLGFQAESEQDSVQLFFYTAQMKPTEMAEHEVEEQGAISPQHPNLQSPMNRVKQ